MGLIVYIYRSAGPDCSNNGVSSGVSQLTLTNVEGPFDANPDRPAALLVKGNVPGAVKIVPQGPEGEVIPGWLMFGGNYAGSSDSRFHEAVERLGGPRFGGPVAVHDRIEG